RFEPGQVRFGRIGLPDDDNAVGKNKVLSLFPGDDKGPFDFPAGGETTGQHGYLADVEILGKTVRDNSLCRQVNTLLAAEKNTLCGYPVLVAGRRVLLCCRPAGIIGNYNST